VRHDLKVRHGGRILADALVGHGVKLAFGVPGESYLPVLDGFHDVADKLKFIVCRQEGGASYMAEAYGKLTGTPGVLFVTRGPGATNWLEALPSCTAMLAWPGRSRRSRRSTRISSSARTRPSLRVRRASTPFLIHTSSCARRLSNKAFSRASLASWPALRSA
jgi:thiamine pyrophosphate-dependent acetolactate synthase large subunit-like protein